MLALLVLVIMAASGVWSVYNKDRESRILRSQSELELSHLQAQQARLSSDIARLETPRGQEETLRAQYAVGKQGEGMIVIVEPEREAPVEATTTPGVMHWFESLFNWR